MQAYTLTEHAMRRIEERRITPENILRALECRSPVFLANGTAQYHDPSTRLRVVVDPATRTIVTVYKIKRRFNGKGKRQ